MASAPDWVTKATWPSPGIEAAKLALSPRRGTISPRQFGPSTRRPSKAAPRRATSASSAAPSAPVSRKPAEITATAPTPASPQAWTTSGTVAAGVQTTARSGVSGVSPTAAYACTPWIDSCPGFTGYTTPSKPPSSRFRNTM